MVIFYKNRGILVPVYFILSIIGSIIILSEISRKYDLDLNSYLKISPGIIISAIITYLFSEDYIKNEKGIKIKVEIDNSFYFIKMKWWSYIFIISGFLVLAYGAFKMLSK